MPEATIDPTKIDATEHYRQRYEEVRRSNRFRTGAIVGAVATYLALLAWELLVDAGEA